MVPIPPHKKRIALISTGGTIEKIYDERRGVLENMPRDGDVGGRTSVLDVMLTMLVLDGVDITRVRLMNKDSLDMDQRDHERIADAAAEHAQSHDGVVIVHGTDRLATTGEVICNRADVATVPIVLTGAMRPYEMRNTDALQNLTEAMLAVQVLGPGVYCVMHNKVLAFPGVIKDRQRGTFAKKTST